jgi:hypothetical protein
VLLRGVKGEKKGRGRDGILLAKGRILGTCRCSEEEHGSQWKSSILLRVFSPHLALDLKPRSAKSKLKMFVCEFAIAEFHHTWAARCVSHKGKTLVVYHKGTVNFPCGIFSHKALSSISRTLVVFCNLSLWEKQFVQADKT